VGRAWVGRIEHINRDLPLRKDINQHQTHLLLNFLLGNKKYHSSCLTTEEHTSPPSTEVSRRTELLTSALALAVCCSFFVLHILRFSKRADVFFFQSLHTERLTPLRRASRVEAPPGLAVVQQAVVEQAV
jgi:hypothetical protein